ncbi:MAG: hypothetical protein M1275_03240 [Patescibacteria group bacterium]|nr:hypothetical protein [Patescibacteria group bacterium]
MDHPLSVHPNTGVMRSGLIVAALVELLAIRRRFGNPFAAARAAAGLLCHER